MDEIDSKDPWIGASAAADMLGVDRSTFFRWRKMGMVPEPGGYRPFGQPRWRSSTILRMVADGVDGPVYLDKEKGK